MMKNQRSNEISVEEKYKFLCSFFKLQGLDHHENDGWIYPKHMFGKYFQFSAGADPTVDDAVEYLMFNSNDSRRL